MRRQYVDQVRPRFDALRPLIAVGAVVAVLTVLVAATLRPFEWVPPRTVNAATYRAAGGLDFPDLGIALGRAPPPWLGAAIAMHRLDLSLRVEPASARQRGPARILTLSRDIHRRNLTVAQESRDLVIRLRTPETDDNGLPSINLSDVFGRPGPVDIRIAIEPGRTTVWIDGEVAASRQLPLLPLAGWDPSYRLALGNELSGDRPWLGVIHRAVVSADGASIDYAIPGALEVPSRYWLFHRRFNFVPLTQTTVTDCVGNILLFIPVGFVLALAVPPPRRRAIVGLVLAVASISVAIETLQVGFAGRYPSLNDVLFNSIGGAAGVVLAHRLRLSKATNRIM